MPKKSSDPKKRIGQKKAGLGECCDLMKLVLSRELPKRAPVCGLEIAPWFSTSGGTGVALVLHFPRAKTRSGEFDNTTYAVVRVCPFCGGGIK